MVEHPLRPVRIGVIEDNEHLRTEMCALLGEDPRLSVVGQAGDAATGMDLVRASQPDVVILDVGLPDRNGSELAVDIRLAFPATQIVAHTAADDRATILAMLRAGAIAYAVKGRDAMQLGDIAMSAFHGNNYLDDSVAQTILPELLKGLNTNPTGPDPDSRRWTEELLYEGRFRMALQPIVELETGAVVGAEALLRVEGADAPPPDELFRRAEAGGLRSALELKALEAALEVTHRLPPGAYLSVNASPDVAQSSELIDLIRQRPATLLVVEITEHDRIEDYVAMRQAMCDLKQTGVRIAVDDAGSGFASLQHILDLEPDIIKLDRDLIRDIDKDRNRRALARALSAYASEIHVAIIAEGIETEAELRTLEQMGVGFGQGFLLEEPTFHDIATSITLPRVDVV